MPACDLPNSQEIAQPCLTESKLHITRCCALQDVPERLRQLRDPGGKLLHGAGKHRSRDWWKVSLRNVVVRSRAVVLPADQCLSSCSGTHLWHLGAVQTLACDLDPEAECSKRRSTNINMLRVAGCVCETQFNTTRGPHQ